MTGARVVRLVGLTVNVVVLAVSGTYLLVYLYRWEWNRAQISGIFFLIALIMFVTTRVLARLRRIEERLGDRGPGAGATPTDAHEAGRLVARANDRHAARHFDWLRDTGEGFGVFVPILIGAGAILSGVAYLIERAAGLFAASTVDRRTTELLAPELPLGPPRPLQATAVATTGRRQGRGGRVLIGLLLAVALLVGTVLLLREATRTRAEPSLGAATTTVELAISHRGESVAVEDLAEALWIACRNRLPEGAEVDVVAMAGSNTATLEVDQGMGPLRRRRFFGCLADATLDRTTARVTGFEVDAGA